MPAVALALSGVAYVARLTRAAANDELRREHVDTARGRGIPEGSSSDATCCATP